MPSFSKGGLQNNSEIVKKHFTKSLTNVKKMKQLLRKNGRSWIIQNMKIFWSQVFDGSMVRDIYIGNLKLEGEKMGGKWFRPANFREFKKYVFDQLHRFKDLKYPAVYISPERYLAGEVLVRDLFFDIDFDENHPEEAYGSVKVLNLKLSKLGIHILWSLSGNGIHGRLDMAPIYNGMEWGKMKQLLQKSHVIYANFVLKIERYLKDRGYNVVFDKKIYGSRRLFRALYSPHETKEIIEIPLDFRWSLKTNYALARVEFARVKGEGLMGYVEDPNGFMKLLDFSLIGIDAEKTPRIRPRVKTRGEWRFFGDIKYRSSMEGYGWIERIVRDKIYFEDGRETFIWYVLSKAVANEIISMEEAEEWVRECIEKYPDQENSAEHYIQKLRYNSRVKVNPPTWRTILTESGSRKQELRHLKENILPALIKANLVEEVGEK